MPKFIKKKSLTLRSKAPCVQIDTHTRAHAHAHAHTHTREHTHTLTHTHTHSHTHTLTHTGSEPSQKQNAFREWLVTLRSKMIFAKVSPLVAGGSQ